MAKDYTRQAMREDMEARGVSVSEYSHPFFRRRGPVEGYNLTRFKRALGIRTPIEVYGVWKSSRGEWIEVYTAYDIWLSVRYPKQAKQILDADFELRYQSFAKAMDAALS